MILENVMKPLHLKSCYVFLPLLFITTLSYASTVNQANVTTFKDGDTAVAAQVNANFTALITAINDNAARITALETGVASSSSVAGTYDLLEMSVDIDPAGSDSYALSGKNVSGSVTLNANGTGTFSTNEYYRTLGFNHIGIQVRNSGDNGTATVNTHTIGFSESTTPESGSLTWTLSNGVVTLNVEGSNLPFMVAGSRLLMQSYHDDEGQIGIIFLVRH